MSEAARVAVRHLPALLPAASFWETAEAWARPDGRRFVPGKATQRATLCAAAYLYVDPAELTAFAHCIRECHGAGVRVERALVQAPPEAFGDVEALGSLEREAGRSAEGGEPVDVEDSAEQMDDATSLGHEELAQGAAAAENVESQRLPPGSLPSADEKLTVGAGPGVTSPGVHSVSPTSAAAISKSCTAFSEFLAQERAAEARRAAAHEEASAGPELLPAAAAAPEMTPLVAAVLARRREASSGRAGGVEGVEQAKGAKGGNVKEKKDSASAQSIKKGGKEADRDKSSKKGAVRKESKKLDADVKVVATKEVAAGKKGAASKQAPKLLSRDAKAGSSLGDAALSSSHASHGDAVTPLPSVVSKGAEAEPPSAPPGASAGSKPPAPRTIALKRPPKLKVAVKSAPSGPLAASPRPTPPPPVLLRPTILKRPVQAEAQGKGEPEAAPEGGRSLSGAKKAEAHHAASDADPAPASSAREAKYWKRPLGVSAKRAAAKGVAAKAHAMPEGPSKDAKPASRDPSKDAKPASRDPSKDAPPASRDPSKGALPASRDPSRDAPAAPRHPPRAAGDKAISQADKPSKARLARGRGKTVVPDSASLPAATSPAKPKPARRGKPKGPLHSDTARTNV